MLSEHLKLLIRRESKEVVGRSGTNLWLLALVLTAMFVSIAFSNGSLQYLSYKMNDPFTNWVSIPNMRAGDEFDRFHASIQETEVQDHYGFGDVQLDRQYSLSFVGADEHSHYLQSRFFGNLDSELIKAILSEDNVVGGAAIDYNKRYSSTVGFIITEDVLNKLSYKADSIPAYVSYYSYSPNADTLGVKLIENKFAEAPMPVLGVVKRLPNNMDMVAARYFIEQYYNNDPYTFDLNNLDYQRSLIFFADAGVSKDDLLAAAREVVPDSLKDAISVYPNPDNAYPHLESWKPGEIFTFGIEGVNLLPTQLIQDIAAGIEKHFEGKNDVTRLFDYKGSDHSLPSDDFISVNFSTLDSIRAFEKYAKDNFNVRIEMSQVNAKENFNAVSVMANILSWAMIVFSMVCIVMFIINMLQSYFQKVKRNIGTFKAFGISSGSLVAVYSLIIVCIVAAAIVIALAVAWLTQELLPLLGVMKDGTFNYLSLWSMKTVWSIVIVIVATLVTVRLVMGRLLHRTPGDLIYDRN